MSISDKAKRAAMQSQDPGTKHTDGRPVAPGQGESGIIWILWATYGAFYFCRTNISAAVPGLKAAVEDGGMGLSGEEVGPYYVGDRDVYLGGTECPVRARSGIFLSPLCLGLQRLFPIHGLDAVHARCRRPDSA